MLAILAMVAGMSWPALQKPWRKSRLSSAARMLQAELGRARTAAIESGNILQFCHQPGTGRFAVRESLVIGPDESSSSTTGGGSGNFDDEGVDVKILPANVVFREIKSQDASALLPGESSGGSGNEQPLGEISDVGQLPWSQTITFYPNGRVSGGRLRLAGGEYYVDVTLRGLTGTAKIGAVVRRQERGDGEQGIGGRGQMPEPLAASPDGGVEGG